MCKSPTGWASRRDSFTSLSLVLHRWFACLALCVIPLLSGAAMAQSWNPASPLVDGRFVHTATLLPNGKVLVAGGSGRFGVLASAEVYDPARNSWSTAASLLNARYGHTATRLSNGKVLVVGGIGGTGTLSSAELYDPASNTWSPAAGLAAVRAAHTATELPDGKILIAGGSDNVGNSLTTAELYDPVTNHWSAVGNTLTARHYPSATLLPNGKVLLSGGYTRVGNNNHTVLSSAELYDPSTQSWSAAGNLNVPRFGGSAILLPEGKVLVAGGANNTDGYLSSSELFDPVANTWSTTGQMAFPRASTNATLLPNGQVLIEGGENNGYLTSAELYDPSTHSWSSTGSMSTARHQHTATLLASGKVVIVGGSDNTPQSLSTVELYEPSTTGMWSAAGNMAQAAKRSTSTLLPDGMVMIAGGSGGIDSLATVELYNPASNGWVTTAPLGIPRESHTATLLPNGKVLVAGGITVTYANGTTQARALASAELYDPANHTWSTAGTMSVAHSNHTATLLPNGKVLIAGGSGNVVSSAEVYDPIANSWSAAGDMGATRSRHTATSLPSGKVLVAGGATNQLQALSSAEIYDPATNSWAPTASTAIAHASHTAILLAGGNVLIAGGFSSNGYVADAELYDPVTGTWSTTSSLLTARYLHTATLLTSGKVLVAGGYNSVTGYLSSSELYDPVTQVWTTAGDMASTRQYHAATLLPSGKVLITSGRISGGPPSGAEQFLEDVQRQTSRQPLVTQSTPVAMRFNAAIALDGTGIKGDSEASGGGTNSSATHLPLVQLRSLESNAIAWLQPSTSTSTRYVSAPLATMAPGWYALRVFVNGIPSTAQLLKTATVPSAPVAVSATAGNAQAEMHWTAPADDGGSPLLEYTATASPGGATCTALAPAVSCNIQGLTPGQAYSITVTVRNAVGSSAPTSASTALTPVSSVTTTVPGMSGTASAVLSGGGAGCAMQAGAGFGAATNAPQGVRLPYGQFSFQAAGCVGTVTLTLSYPEALPANVQFLKFGPAAIGATRATWFVWNNATLSPDRKSVSYTLTDNGIGDNDPTTGRISDPFAPAMAQALEATSITGVPVDAPWALVLLSAGFLVVAGRQRRRNAPMPE